MSGAVQSAILATAGLLVPFWCQLTWVVPDKVQEGCKMVVCVCDFQEAIAKYEVVTQNLEFARELQKQFQVIGNDVSLSHLK